MERFRTDYVDDQLNASVNTRRKYNMVTNDDGTISLIDATDYLKTGDEFGAHEVNQIHEKLNAIDDTISDAYDPTKTYAVGDYCIYENTLYRCTTEVTAAEAFNSSKWSATTVGSEIGRRTSGIIIRRELSLGSVTLNISGYNTVSATPEQIDGYSPFIVTIRSNANNENVFWTRCMFADNGDVQASFRSILTSGTVTFSPSVYVYYIKASN